MNLSQQQHYARQYGKKWEDLPEAVKKQYE